MTCMLVVPMMTALGWIHMIPGCERIRGYLDWIVEAFRASLYSE